MITSTSDGGYVVHFEGKGFYADKQPHYEWSFTHELDKPKYTKPQKGQLNYVNGQRNLKERSIQFQ